MTIKTGDRIQHISGAGDVLRVVLERPDWGDVLAVTEEADPSVIRVINPDNWKILEHAA